MAEGHRRRRRAASLTGPSTAVRCCRRVGHKKSASEMKKTVAAFIFAWPENGDEFVEARRAASLPYGCGPIDRKPVASWLVVVTPAKRS